MQPFEVISVESKNLRTGIFHGAGYAGGALIELVLRHPELELSAVTSRSFQGRPVYDAHPSLKGSTTLVFSSGIDDVPVDLDAVLIAAEHGSGGVVVAEMYDAGYEGKIVDLSADFRFSDEDFYRRCFGFEHPAPHLLGEAVYGLPEIGTVDAGVDLVANPGCFATAITLALKPVADHIPGSSALVTALTGASGSGSRPSGATHFPTRYGNVRAYRVLAHQHVPEVLQAIDNRLDVSFVPASGPWSRGIWGTAHIKTEGSCSTDTIGAWFEDAYADSPCVRLWPGEFPEMRYSLGTPFCDLGWVVQGDRVVVGFALDNLLKGAASQAVQNLNLMLGIDESTGLGITNQRVGYHAVDS